MNKKVKEKSGKSLNDSGITLQDHMEQAKEIMINAANADITQPEADGAAHKASEFEEKAAEIRKRGNNHTSDVSAIVSRSQNISNWDVVTAMQIAEEKLVMAEAAGELTADHPRYVVHGAKLVCSCGTREARLVVPLDHGIYINDHPQLNVCDCKALTNIKCFGNCTSTRNPMMEENAAEAVKKFNDENPKKLFTKGRKIEPGKELLELCICECIPQFLAQEWSEGNDKHSVGYVNALTQPANIVCTYGGIIRIYDDGQEE